MASCSIFIPITTILAKFVIHYRMQMVGWFKWSNFTAAIQTRVSFS